MTILEKNLNSSGEDITFCVKKQLMEILGVNRKGGEFPVVIKKNHAGIYF